MANIEQFDKVESKPIQLPHSHSNLDRKAYYEGFAGLADLPNFNPVKDGQINFSDIFKDMKGVKTDKPAPQDSIQMELSR